MPYLFLLLLTAASLFGADKNEPLQRLDEAAAVFKEIMGTPDKSIPQDLLDKSQCIVVVPSLKKGAFIVGAKYGKGYISCRKPGEGWSAPGTIRIEGGGKLTLGGYDKTHRVGIQFDNVVFDSPDKVKIVAAHSDVKSGPGAFNLKVSGDDITQSGAPGQSSPNACASKFEPFPLH